MGRGEPRDSDWGAQQIWSGQELDFLSVQRTGVRERGKHSAALPELVRIVEHGFAMVDTAAVYPGAASSRKCRQHCAAARPAPSSPTPKRLKLIDRRLGRMHLLIRWDFRQARCTFQNAWTEDRALVETNASADPGMEARRDRLKTTSSPISTTALLSSQGEKFRGLGQSPRNYHKNHALITR
jgi:hypothetical protein